MGNPLTKRPVHQLVNHLSRGDAIGHDVLTIQDRLRAAGHPSEIFCLHHGPGLAGRHKPASAFPDHSSPDNILIWHFSLGTSLFDLASHAREKVVMRYHNITPHKYFTGINPQLELDCRMGRRQLAQAASFVHLGVGDSAYNRAELDALGYINTGNCPIMLDLDEYTRTREGDPNSTSVSEGPTILHVGRLMPQKRYEQLIVTHYFLKKIKPKARLIMVGGWDGLERYKAYLDGLIAELDLEGVNFTGRVSDIDLRALYTQADIYLCLSDHEGFCVPLVEAMKMDIPIVAKRSSAVGETMGRAGVVLEKHESAQTAEVLAALVDDREMLERVRVNQQKRLMDFHPDVVWERLVGLLEGAGCL